MEIIEINGSIGEGGGQILRSSLTLSVLAQRNLYIHNIRSKRRNPGLQSQHLRSVDAAAAISKADINGAQLGSTEMIFKPKEIRTGRYRFDIGTAGSTGLVLQTIAMPLSIANSASFFRISGGTHVPWSPCYDFINMHWCEVLNTIGFSIHVNLDQAGFFPKGGGRISTTIRPAKQISHLNMVERGRLNAIVGISAVANLSRSIAERQKKHALRRLLKYSDLLKIKTVEMPSHFKGTILLLIARFDNGRGCFYSLGELGKPAEVVADEAVDQLEVYLNSDQALDPYLADQLMIPLLFSDEASTYSTYKITQHQLTNAFVVNQFFPNSIEIHGELGHAGVVNIIPGNYATSHYSS